MRVLGIDFTSAPSRSKPLACAVAHTEGAHLMLDAIFAMDSLECFGNLLLCEGPWIAGMDFPFGLPRDFVEPLDWPRKWCGYVDAAASLERAEFKDLARSVASRREPGERYSLREVDRLAGAASPMNVTRPPVGLMFHAGAPSLLASGATVLPVHAGDPQRTVVEAYPKLVAQALIGRRPYKDEAAVEPGEPRSEARAELLRALAGEPLEHSYGLRLVGLDAYEDDLRRDARADGLDAVMCAVQAAWAWQMRDEGYGLPPLGDADEGWIADPAVCART